MKPKHRNPLFRSPVALIFATGVATLILPTASLEAASETWDGGGASGIWGGVNNWVSNTPADGAGFTATFANTYGTYADPFNIIVNTNRTIGNISFTGTTNDITISRSSTNILTLDVTTGSPTITVSNSARTLTMSTVIAGTDGLNKAGAGTLTLSGANTYSGTTTIGAQAGNVGTVNITNGSAFGTSAVSMVSNSSNGLAALTLNSATGITVANNFSTSGEGQGGNGIIRNVTGNNLISGNFTLTSGGGNTRIHSDGGSLTLSGNIAPNTTGRALVLGGTATGTVSGNINNGSVTNTLTGLTKQGTGTWTLSGSGNFTGNVTVSAGTLAAGSSASGTSTALGNASTVGRTITVASGANLNFNSANVLSTNFASTSVPSLLVTGTATNNVAGNNALGNVTLSGGTLTATAGHATYGAFNINGTVTSTGNSTISATGGAKMMLTSSGANNVETASTFDVASGTLTVSVDLAEVTSEQKISGLTKIGTGTMVISGTGTYTGATQITGGVLTLSGSGSVNGSSGINVNGSGAKLLHTSGTAITSAVNLTQGTLTGTGTVNAVNVADTVNAIITNNDGVAGASLTIGALTFSGAATVNTFSNGISAPIITTSLDSNIAGMVTINPTAASWANGTTYDLISYGSVGGAGLAQFALGTVTGLTARQSTVLGSSGTAITLGITGDTPKWTGLDNANWQIGTTGASENWRLVTAGTPTSFLATDDVLFDDSATGGTSVNINLANVAPSNTTFNNSTLNYTLGSTGGFGITSGGLTKTGSGLLTITNTNTYTGATAINGGTLQLGDGNASGALATGSAISVGAGATFAVNQFDTVTQGTDFGSAAITGAGNFTQAGSGTTVFTAANSFTGITAINGGTLQLGDGGTGGALTGTTGITSSGSATLAINRSNTFTQATDLNGQSIPGADLALTKAGGGTATLSAANSYGGLTTVDGGALRISDPGALGSTAAGIVVNGNTSGAGSNARLELSGDITVTGESATIYGNGNFLGAMASFSGTNEWAGGVTIGSTGTRIGANTASTLKVSGVIDSAGNNHGLIVRTADLTGIVVLSGANTYIGDTNVLIGKLQLDGGDNRLPVGTNMIISSGGTNPDAEFDLNGRNQEVAGLSIGTGISTKNSVNNSSVTLSTLTVNTAAASPSTFAGILKGNLALAKTGADTLTLTGNNTFTGGTSVTTGTLIAAKNSTTVNALGTGSVSVAGGSTALVNILKTTNLTDSIDNTFTGSGLLKIQFAAGTTARNITMPNVTGFGGTIQLSSLGTTADKWNATNLGTVTGSLLIDSGNTIFTSGGNSSFTGGITVSGAGNSEGRGAIRLSGPTTVLGGNISLAGSSTISMENVSAQITGNISGGVAGNHTLTLGASTGSTGGILGGNISDGSGVVTVTQAAGSYNLSGILSHTGGINVTNGTLTLGNSANSYTGVTAIGTGAGRVVVVTADGALGAIGTGNETTLAGIVGATGPRLGFSGGISYTTAEKVSGAGSGDNRGFIQSVSGSNTFAGPIELNANGQSRIGTQNGAQLTLTGPITQAAGITSATLLFRTGDLNGDFVTLSNTGNSFGGDSQIFSGLANAGEYAGVRLGVSNALPTDLTISAFSGAGAGTALDLNGRNQTLNGLITGGATLRIVNLDTVNPSTLTLNPTSNKATNNTLILGGGGLGAINVEKVGTFNQTLSGTHTHTGDTSVSAGTLYVSGALAASAVTVAPGAALGSNGAAGTLGNGLTIQAGGKLDLTAATLSLDSTGILSLIGGSLTLGNLAFTDLVGWDWANADVGTYELIDGSFSVDFGTTAFLSEATAFDFGNGKKGYFTSGSLNAVIIPEPSTALLGAIGVLALLRRRRA